ncbi:hypothetical protein SFRURICE_003492 [Spodoptera frugiperda]|nr:hypothetical protein SFRURICE_003492 [Spodoptera frugiperda]
MYTHLSPLCYKSHVIGGDYCHKLGTKQNSMRENTETEFFFSKNRKKPSNSLPNPGIEPETSCPAVALIFFSLSLLTEIELGVFIFTRLRQKEGYLFYSTRTQLSYVFYIERCVLWMRAIAVCYRKLIRLRPLIRIIRTARRQCLHAIRTDDVIRNAYDAGPWTLILKGCIENTKSKMFVTRNNNRSKTCCLEP